MIRGTVLLFVLEHAVHTYFAINLSRKKKLSLMLWKQYLFTAYICLLHKQQVVTRCW